MNYYFLFASAIGANICAQVLLKMGAQGLNKGIANDFFSKLKMMAAHPCFWLALVFYGLSFATYSVVLSKLELSRAYPVASVAAIAAVFLISVIFWHETATVAKIIGLALCLVGIFLIFK